jgi:hypothetical protein
MKNFWSVLLIRALAAGGVQAEVFVEDWAEALNREVYHGQIGVKTATGVADILTPTEVVGVCSLKGAPDKIILLSRMADDLKLRATVIVILDEGDKLDRLDPIREQARKRPGVLPAAPDPHRVGPHRLPAGHSQDLGQIRFDNFEHRNRFCCR